MVIAGRPPPDSAPSLSWETLPPSQPSHLGNPSCAPPACPAQHAGRWFLLQLLDHSCIAEPRDSRTVALPASSPLSTAPSLLLPHSRRNHSAVMEHTASSGMMGQTLLSFTPGILTPVLPAQGNWAAQATRMVQNFPITSQWVKFSPQLSSLTFE